MGLFSRLPLKPFVVEMLMRYLIGQPTMGAVTIIHNGHQIRIEWSVWTGKEKVSYDGQIMSDRHTIAGGIHVFTVNEGSETAQYEVRFSLGVTSPPIEVRRNGIIIYSNR
jgi:hypothetical protein